MMKGGKSLSRIIISIPSFFKFNVTLIHNSLKKCTQDAIFYVSNLYGAELKQSEIDYFVLNDFGILLGYL